LPILGELLSFVGVPAAAALWRFDFALTLFLEFRTRGRDTDSCVMVDPLPLEPLDEAVTPESREIRELIAAFLTPARLVFLSCVESAPELSMSPICLR
jgi:hypothetical protein